MIKNAISNVTFVDWQGKHFSFSHSYHSIRFSLTSKYETVLSVVFDEHKMKKRTVETNRKTLRNSDSAPSRDRRVDVKSNTIQRGSFISF